MTFEDTNAQPAPSPGTTPTDAPPPPGPQTDVGTVTNAPSTQPARTSADRSPHSVEGGSAFLPDGTPIDNVGIVRATVKHPQTGQDIEVTAAATRGDVATGAAGQALTGAGEMGGGNIAQTLAPRPPANPAVQTQQRLERAASSQVVQRFGGLVNRPLLEWGLVGQNDVVPGHMILVDLDSGAKVRVMPGTRIEEDRLFANSRNLPEWLINGDALDRIAGGASSPSLPAPEPQEATA